MAQMIAMTGIVAVIMLLSIKVTKAVVVCVVHPDCNAMPRHPGLAWSGRVLSYSVLQWAQVIGTEDCSSQLLGGSEWRCGSLAQASPGECRAAGITYGLTDCITRLFASSICIHLDIYLDFVSSVCFHYNTVNQESTPNGTREGNKDIQLLLLLRLEDWHVR
ncbi:hypothetical protein E2C01_009198 [Portunus trituberculatus]|uniref:Secreted protein n=1 Tax=Portunus trituberculatus TaxID=210409 RepID=A0A5B7D5B7_PORTR|nr:hypothetical protein [Portunus trituberculatus]